MDVIAEEHSETHNRMDDSTRVFQGVPDHLPAKAQCFLLKDARKGDVLLVESIDRLSRHPVEDWQKLKAAIDSKGLRIVALDLPTSHQGIQDTKGHELTGRMLGAIHSMLVEMMAAIARKDYEQRRERLAQGIDKTKAAGKYQGRPVDEDLHKRVKELLAADLGVRAAARHASCSTTTVLKIMDRGPRVTLTTAARAEGLEVMEVAAMALVADDAQALSPVRAEMTTVLARSCERSTASSLAGPFYADRAEGQP